MTNKRDPAPSKPKLPHEVSKLLRVALNAGRKIGLEYSRGGLNRFHEMDELVRVRDRLSHWVYNSESMPEETPVPVQPASDAEVFTRAVIAGVARWEPFTGMIEEGEVCVGGLRHGTRLEAGVPVLSPLLRESLEYQTRWARPAQKATASDSLAEPVQDTPGRFA